MKTFEEALEYIKQLEVAIEAQKDVTERNVRRFFIPTIGTSIKIISDTPVSIWIEYRNIKFLEKVFPEYMDGDTGWSSLCWGREKHEVLPPCVKSVKSVKRSNEHIEWYDNYAEYTLPKGTVIIVDRIYIRKGKDMKEFDSITFRVEKQKGNKLTGRFWLKRSDVNNLVVEVVKEEP